MKMHDTGYKMHEGVNTISGVCESADTKQYFSLGRKKIRNFIKAVEYAPYYKYLIHASGILHLAS
jgi:hypothetical protein